MMEVQRGSRGAYFYSCPNCGGPTGDARLQARLPCPLCLPHWVAAERIEDVWRAVAEEGRLRREGRLNYYAELERRVREVEELFEKATGCRLWSAQRMWAKRVLKGKSFAIIAPTGLGKTTFGVLMAVYLASKGKASYIVLPTTPLTEMVEEKALRIARVAGVEDKVLAIHSRLSRKVYRERLRRLLESDYLILITTARFLMSRLEDIIKSSRRLGGFSFVFVDDVDAVLKSGKSVDAILKVMGFTDNDIDTAYELLKRRRRLALEVAKYTAALARTGVGKEREKARQSLLSLYQEVMELEEKVKEARKKVGVLVVSSATGRPRGSRVRLFQVLLGFQAGAKPETLRNVVDTYLLAPGMVEEKAVELVKRLGDGGLVYVPLDAGVEGAERLAEKLREAGVAAEAFTSRNPGALERFRSGELQVLVGVAIYYGVAVRGLDLPERVRYAVFAGVPRLKMSAKLEDPHPYSVLRALGLLAEHAPRDVALYAQDYLGRIRRIIQRMSPAAVNKLAEKLRNNQVDTPEARIVMEAVEFIRDALKRSDVWDSLEKAEDIAIVREEGKTYILIPDATTYIQASGRTSRLYPGGITKGLSIVVADDKRLLNGLIKRTRWWIEAEWKPLEEVDLPKLLAEINRDRERVRAILEGRIKPEEVQELVKTVLMIVESPNKARTIANFFGKPSSRQIGPLRVYETSTGKYVLLIAASGGHVYDLVKPLKPKPITPEDWLKDKLVNRVEEVDWNKARNLMGVFYDGKHYIPVYTPLQRCPICGKQWTRDPTQEVKECPSCQAPIIRDSYEIVKALEDLATEVDMVFIGTDPDTEGEKIGWDIASLIAPYTPLIRRIEFHEITRKAILKALDNPRDFKTSLVEAQIVRRVEDRWIGFTLSPLLWLKFWPMFCEEILPDLLKKYQKAIALTQRKKKLEEMLRAVDRVGKKLDKLKAAIRACSDINYNLSAGRVQTPVLKWIVDRYSLYKQTMTRMARITLENNLTLEAPVKELPDPYNKHPKNLKGREARVEVVSREEVEVNPLPPYTTDTMLADAATKLRLSAPEAMRIAQDLFELGFITYHRTDSTRVSDAGIAVAREYLREKYGDRYKELFKPRRWGTGGAHEAIRPTRPIDVERLRRLIAEGIIQPARPLTRRHYALYDLIFRRFIASQMKPARLVKAKVKISIDGYSRELELYTEVREKGFLEFYQPFTIQPVTSGTYRVVEVRVFKWSPYPPYTQADIIRMMKERGIGRPSTYAKIIDTLLRRKYVRLSKRKGYLIPRKLGRKVCEFLYKYYKEHVSEEVTRRLQERMDRIEEGLEDYREVLDSLRREIEGLLEEVRKAWVRYLIWREERWPELERHVSRQPGAI
ncbi:MAG: reverse gyrase [Crenarchaeota archaeon]|nr:reverse gyrase [Thermoproteota archaeon]